MLRRQLVWLREIRSLCTKAALGIRTDDGWQANTNRVYQVAWAMPLSLLRRGTLGILSFWKNPTHRHKKMLRSEKPTIYRKWGKRGLDMIMAGSLLVIISPILLGLWGLVWLRLGSPVLFRQDRPGLQGRTFKLYKFRTMTHDRDPAGNFLTDEVRLTRFGRWLRETSLDELPEIWNILIGDMSFVGPRPLLVQYLPLYNPEQARRHEVRPGLTGWAQIHGRNATTWEERLARDLWYVDNLSLRTDLAIAFATFGKVLAREGIRHDASPTMPVFTGTKPGNKPSSHAA